MEIKDKEKTRLLCPYCKEKEGRFIRKNEDLVEIYEDKEGSWIDEFLMDNGSPHYVCESCAKEIDDNKLFNPKED